MSEPTEFHLTVHQWDPEAIAAAIAAWLPGALGFEGHVGIEDVHVPEGAGMSSVTVLFSATWTVDGSPRTTPLVARLAPDPGSFPVFPTYDLRRQADLLAAVATHSAVPVPRVLAAELTGSVLGTEFLLIEAVQGRTPADNPPYVFGGWLLDATADERKTLQEATVAAIAGIHAINDPGALVEGLTTPADPLRTHVDTQRDYYAWTCAEDGVAIPVIDEAFTWLDEHWPSITNAAVLCWGDARPGNVIYDGFTPRAVLDWEMAAIAPPEVDLGWIVFLHQFFQDIAEVFELPGLPDFCVPDDITATYHATSGIQPRDLDWFIVYAALRQAIVMARIKRRMIHFGEEQRPNHPDDYVMHAARLHALIDGAR